MSFDMHGNQPLATLRAGRSDFRHPTLRRTLLLADRGTAVVGFLGLALGYCATVSGLALPGAPSLLLLSLSTLCLSSVLHIIWFSQKGRLYAAIVAVAFLVLTAALLHALLNSNGARDIVALVAQGSEDVIKLRVGGVILVLVLAFLAWMRYPPTPDELGEIDYTILESLQREALTDKKLMERFGRHGKGLEFFLNNNYIKGPVYVLRAERLKDLGVYLCFMSVKLSDKTHDNIAAFKDFVKKDARILEIYSLSGENDYLMKVRLRNETEVERMAEDFTDLSANLTTIHILDTIYHTHVIPFSKNETAPPKLNTNHLDANGRETHGAK